MTARDRRSVEGPRMTNHRTGFFFVLPAVLLLLIILGFPACAAILQSFDILWADSATGAGLANYVAVATDPAAWNALWITAKFVVLTVVFHLVFGLLVALLLNKNMPGKWFFRVAAILPWTIPDIIAGIVWRFMLDPLGGFLNALLAQLGMIQEPVDWLGTANSAFASIVAAESWRGYPFVMLILLAGLQTISREQYEAAQVDGANSFQSFVYVTLPNLKRMIFVAVILDTIWEARLFGLVYGMTSGGPGDATEVMPVIIYQNYFEFFNTGYAAALAVALGVIMVAVATPYIRYMLNQEGATE
jgi:multiple sugar transport system permease protein